MAGRTKTPLPAAPQHPSLRNPLIILALFIPLLAGAWYARHAAESIVGPLAVAVGDREIAVLAPGALYRLDLEGALKSTDTELVSATTGDGGLAWHGDSLLVSPGVEDELLRCTGDQCAPFSTDNYAPRGPVQSYFDGTRFWFSETEADRIQRYDVSGKRIDMPASDLSGPGSLWTRDNLLYVADSGNRRVARYVLHKRGIDEAESFATWSDHDPHDPVNVPRRLLAEGEGFQALFSNATRTRGNLVHIDAEGGTELRDVEGLVNPVDLARFGDDLLVVDEHLMQLLRVNAKGEASVFGDDEFQAALAEQQSLREGLLITSPVLATLAVLALILGGTWLLWVLTWRPTDPAMVVKPDAEGIVWLPAECDLAPQRIPRYLLIASPVALVPAAAIIFATPYWLPAVGWALLCFAATAAVPLRAAMRAKLPKGERIGLRDRQLIVTHPESGRREYALPQVAWSEQFLRPEPNLDVPLMRDGIPLYHPATVEELLLPRLNLMRKLT